MSIEYVEPKLSPTMLTVVVCTYNRPKKLKRLIESCNTHLPGVDIIVGDVSDKDQRGEIPEQDNLTWMRHEWPEGVPNPNIGNLSAGRNLALSQVGTPHFLLLDDGHYFEDEASVVKMQQVLRSGQGIDLVGGNYYQEGIVRWFGFVRMEGRTCRLYSPKIRDEEKPIMCDFTLNFFMARTADVAEIGWDEELPIVSEHMDFFMRAKIAGLKVAHLDCVGVRHDPGGDIEEGARSKQMTPAKRHYQKMRRRFIYRKAFYDKWGIRTMLQHNGVKYWISAEEKLKRDVLNLKASQGVIVMTTGRSGSSALGQVLHTMGVNMGNHLGAPSSIDKRKNRDGYFEDLSWSLKEVKPDSEEFEEQMREHIEKMALSNSRWGMKIPKLSRYAGLIKKIADESGLKVKFVWIHRPLSKCINSLNRTGWVGDDFDRAYEVMTQNYTDVRKAFNELPDEVKRIVEYEELLEDPLGVVRPLAHWVDVTEGAAIVKAAETVNPELATF